MGIQVTDTGIVTLVAVLVAVIALLQKRNLSRITHTLQFIEDYNSDPRVDEAHRFLHSIKGKSRDEQLSKFSENRADFLFLLNKFEILAIGLKERIYDKSMIKDCFGYDIHRIYFASEDLISHIRENDSDKEAFSHFERLAAKNKVESTKP